jgi:immune inhibitor A
VKRKRASESKPTPLESVAGVYEAANTYAGRQRCMVAPSPELQSRLLAEMRDLKTHASPSVRRLIKLRDKDRVGFNDGLICPGSYFPIGTPAHLVRSAAAQRAPLRGVVRVIVVLVDFSDEGFTAAHDRAHYEALFFSEGVLPNGSVREYFRDVTNDLVLITGEVVGPYRMPHTLQNYANGDSGIGSTNPNARDLARAAAEAANDDVDFGPYDNDGDGYVDAFVVVQAGPGAESTGDSNHIWSHKWVLRSVYHVDSTRIYGYLVIPEEAKIGVCCHELGHLLFGFPDLYDTDYSSSGIGNWCLMAGGSWNGGGDIPAHPSAWCKANQEWVTVLNQTNNSVESIEDVKTSKIVRRLWKDGAPGEEYFLVENRQRSGYDAHLPGAGLLIWHIDDSVSSNSDENHPKVALEQADGSGQLEAGDNRGDTGDPYPGSAGNRNFNKTSSPSSSSYGGVDTCVGVENISDSSPVMTAHLKVKCGVVKRMVDEKGLRKELWKEGSKDFFKDIIKERLKEHIKDKDKEWKELKEKELKEWKEKDIFEGPGTGKPGESVMSASQQMVGPIESHLSREEYQVLQARLAAVEHHLTALQPFIQKELRPDLRRSALVSEGDVAQAKSDAVKRGADAKRGKKRSKKR